MPVIRILYVRDGYLSKIYSYVKYIYILFLSKTLKFAGSSYEFCFFFLVVKFLI